MSFTCGHHGWRHALNPCPICNPDYKPAAILVPEMKPEDIVAPLDPFADMTTEEQLMWATPYYDELQAKKLAHQEALNQEAKNG